MQFHFVALAFMSFAASTIANEACTGDYKLMLEKQVKQDKAMDACYEQFEKLDRKQDEMKAMTESWMKAMKAADACVENAQKGYFNLGKELEKLEEKCPAFFKSLYDKAKKAEMEEQKEMEKMFMGDKVEQQQKMEYKVEKHAQVAKAEVAKAEDKDEDKGRELAPPAGAFGYLKAGDEEEAKASVAAAAATTNNQPTSDAEVARTVFEGIIAIAFLYVAYVVGAKSRSESGIIANPVDGNIEISEI